jgi:small basic protein
VSGLHILLIRAVLGAVIAVIIARMFYPQMSPAIVAMLGFILVGLAYLSEYFKARKKNQDLDPKP